MTTPCYGQVIIQCHRNLGQANYKHLYMFPAGASKNAGELGQSPGILENFMNVKSEPEDQTNQLHSRFVWALTVYGPMVSPVSSDFALNGE